MPMTISFVHQFVDFQTKIVFFLQARHRSDREVNNRETKAVVGKEFVAKKWKDIQVGDLIQLTNNELVTVK